MKRLFTMAIAALAITLLSFAPPAWAHIGSPDVFVEDHAGPYRLFVTVRVPQVIPGIAEIGIRSEANDITKITVAPMQLTGPGSQYAPVPDVAERSKTDPQFFTGSLWLMEFGSLRVRIEVEGAQGPGELSVPVPATAQRTLPMPRLLGAILGGLLLVLMLAMISIVAAAVREGSLEPGRRATTSAAGRARVAAGVACFVVLALLLAGGEWWKAEASRYADHVYAPPEMQVALEGGPDATQLLLRENSTRIPAGNPRRDAETSNFDDLLPDHGHLMHFFMIRTPAMDSFWHLHPEPSGAERGFTARLPAVPPGHYQLFADVVLRSGFPVTMVGQIDIPAISGKPLAGDDSGVIAPPITSADADTQISALPDGGRMTWERDPRPLKAGVPLMFRFRVIGSDGQPARDIEPYMGMAAHAEFVRSDGAVFAHVHPSGSAAMAAMELARASVPGGSTGVPSTTMQMSGAAMAGMAVPGDRVDPEISFPYGFPKPGLYRVFVQVKRAGKIETGVFDANVE
jgi:hypothetical protein